MPSMSVSSEKIYSNEIIRRRKFKCRMSGEHRTRERFRTPSVRQPPLLKTSFSMFPGSTIDQESKIGDCSNTSWKTHRVDNVIVLTRSHGCGSIIGKPFLL